MRVRAIRTSRIAPGDSLEALLDRCVPLLEERSVLAVTSKIISLCQNRVVTKLQANKKDLVRSEAEAMVEGQTNPYNFFLTVKDNRLIPSAGIDESNGDGIYILYPHDIQQTATFIWSFLRQKFRLQELGVIITDSHVTPLRRGVTGVALGWCGFKPLHNYIGQPDLYGQPLRVTMINLTDALAAAAALMMGEGSEQTPFAIIENAPKLSFQDRPPTLEEVQETQIPPDEDLFAPLLQSLTWL